MTREPIEWLMGQKWGEFVSKSGASEMILPLQAAVKTLQNNHEMAMGLVRRLAAIEYPEYVEQISGDAHCLFCSAWIEYELHANDCLWSEARRLIEELNEVNE